MKRRVNFGIFIFILAFAFSAFAQTPKPTATPVVDDEVIKVDSRLVIIPVSVTDAAGQPVLGLKAQDFRILEENKPQQIAQISDAEKVPLEIALLFDVSASTDSMFQFEQETAAKFLQEVMRPEDRATIFTIGERAVLIQARDSSLKSAVSIKSIQPTKQFTAFYDTVKTASDYLQKNAPQGRRKVIVVISDGEDTNSEGIRRGFQALYNSLGKNINNLTTKMLADKRDEIKSREQNRVLQSLQNADAVFYSINPAGNSYQLNKISQFGQSNLQRFADQTGGTAFLPKFESITLKNNLQNSYNAKFNQEILTRIFRQLANELQAQYLVQYYSEGDFPANKYVKLAVSLQNPQSFKVRARQGYFVKN
ncbi:MAG: VWA domain-containing protein [Acidobacteriota bacterium]|nr:VWA domain-containing protein [Acidobacteriota bacterium]